MNVPEFALKTCLEYLNKKDLDLANKKKDGGFDTID